MSWQQQDEVWLGLGDYVAGGSCAPPFLKSEGALARRPIVMGSMDLSDGRDAYDSAMMWADAGADGMMIRVSSEEELPTVAMIAQVTGLPIALSGDPAVVSAMASAIEGTVMILMDADAEGHLSAGQNGRIAVFDGLDADAMHAFRLAGLKGDESCKRPILADLSMFPGEPMEEAMVGLEAMLCGADILVMNNPVAADMCRFQGEELAGL